MWHLLKLKCAHSPLNLRILSSTSVPYTLKTVQVPNSELTHKKRITVYRPYIRAVAGFEFFRCSSFRKKNYLYCIFLRDNSNSLGLTRLSTCIGQNFFCFFCSSFDRWNWQIPRRHIWSLANPLYQQQASQLLSLGHYVILFLQK